MGWFGGGSDDSSKTTTSPASKDFTSTDEAAFSNSMSSPGGSYSTSASVGGGGGGSAVEELQAFSMQLQEQLLVQQAIQQMTSMGFDKCIDKPGEALSGREVACIHATVGKWLDSNEFLMGRLQKKQQANSSSY